MAKNEVLDFSGRTCMSKGYFIHILVCKFSFREISIIFFVIFDENKRI